MPLRFAIIGCGNVSHRHAAAIQHVGELVAVCDVNKEKAADLSTKYHCAYFIDVKVMLQTQRPDIVVVCSPSGLHPEHAIECLRAGCHVLCEKPMAIDIQSAQKMLDASQQNSRKLFVVKQNRLSPPVALLKRLVDEKIIGEIDSFQVTCAWNRNSEYYRNSTWRGSPAYDGGILYTQFSHFVDLVGWLFGDLQEAKGWRSNFRHKELVDFEDAGCATLLMKSGAIGSLFYTINAHSHNMEGSIAVFGQRGTVKIGGVYLNRIDHFDVEDKIASQWLKEMPESVGDLHYMVYQELVKALKNESYAFVDATEAMRSVAMIGKIYDGSPLLT